MDWDGLTAGTEYYAYVIGIKADGTYTTEPFKTSFKTIEEKKSKVSVSTAMKAWMLDENAESWMLEKYPANKTNYNLSFDAVPYASAGKLYVKTFTGTDEWAGKSSEELVTLLLKETPTLAQKIITDILHANIDTIRLLLAERCSMYMLSHTTQITSLQIF